MTHRLMNPLTLLPGLLLSGLLLFPSAVHTQSLSTSKIDFTIVPNWNNYRQCVRACFMVCSIQCIDILGFRVGCRTGECLCEDRSVYELGVQAALTCVNRKLPRFCGGNESDQKAATAIMTDYCALQGKDYSDGGDGGTNIDGGDGDNGAITSNESSPSTTSPPTATNKDTISESSSTTINNDTGQSTPPTTSSSSGSGTDNKNGNNDDNSGGGGGKGSSFGTPEIVGTVIGVVSLFCTALGVYVTWKARAKKQRLRQAQQDLNPHVH